VNRGPIAYIDLSSIAHNLRTVRGIVKNRPVIAVVKADAYGHGAIEASKLLVKEGVSHLAVAYTGEAAELRDSGINVPIVVLFDRGETKDYFDLDLIPVIYSMDTAASLSAEADKRHVVKEVYAKVDTGMGRIGFYGDHAVRDLMKISEMPGLKIDGLLSHFSEADLSDRSYAISQLERFKAIQSNLSEKLGRSVFSHVANSAAVLSFQDAHFDAVRPGIMLYGYSPFCDRRIVANENSGITLIPAMKVKTRLLDIRELPAGTPISYGRTFVTNRRSRIGVIPMGYADGYSRALSNNSEVLVRGKQAPVLEGSAWML